MTVGLLNVLIGRAFELTGNVFAIPVCPKTKGMKKGAIGIIKNGKNKQSY
jgi:hypothetical protein